MARRAAATAAGVVRAADAAIPLEFYFPVPAHRAGGPGDGRLLVATAIGAHEAPGASDPQAHRLVLSPAEPPATPVLALVPVETDFSVPPPALPPAALTVCGDYCRQPYQPPPPPPPPPSPGLYMTQAHFTQTFEGWLRGSPEFEVHILGQSGQTDSLKDYQCAGEHQSMPYYFDQNSLDWSGSVMLFSKYQLDNYAAQHPGQNPRVFVVEDDDEACVIKANKDLFKQLTDVVDAANQTLTAGKETTTSAGTKHWKDAKALLKLVPLLGPPFNSNDELVGNAVQDGIAQEYHPGFNWIVKGDQNVTNGWIELEMK